MSKNNAQVPTVIGKNTNSDFGEGFKIVRTITAADVGAVVTSFPVGYASDQGTSRLFAYLKARTAQFRIFSNVSGGTVSLQFISEAPKGPGVRSDDDTLLTKSLPTTIIAAAFTCSGRSCVNMNPITNVSDSNTWYEASDWTAVFTDDSRVTSHPTSAASSYQRFFTVDALGDAFVYPCCYATPSSSGTVIVAARRVD